MKKRNIFFIVLILLATLLINPIFKMTNAHFYHSPPNYTTQELISYNKGGDESFSPSFISHINDYLMIYDDCPFDESMNISPFTFSLIQVSNLTNPTLNQRYSVPNISCSTAGESTIQISKDGILFIFSYTTGIGAERRLSVSNFSKIDDLSVIETIGRDWETNEYHPEYSKIELYDSFYLYNDLIITYSSTRFAIYNYTFNPFHLELLNSYKIQEEPTGFNGILKIKMDANHIYLNRWDYLDVYNYNESSFNLFNNRRLVFSNLGFDKYEVSQLKIIDNYIYALGQREGIPEYEEGSGMLKIFKINKNNSYSSLGSITVSHYWRIEFEVHNSGNTIYLSETSPTINELLTYDISNKGQPLEVAEGYNMTEKQANSLKFVRLKNKSLLLHVYQTDTFSDGTRTHVDYTELGKERIHHEITYGSTSEEETDTSSDIHPSNSIDTTGEVVLKSDLIIISILIGSTVKYLLRKRRN